jgi:hypothetical protein
MQIKNYASCVAAILVFLTLPACKTMQQKSGENAMRIWIAPAYRANTNVNPSGHFYVNVQSDGATQASTASPASLRSSR